MTIFIQAITTFPNESMGPHVYLVNNRVTPSDYHGAQRDLAMRLTIPQTNALPMKNARFPSVTPLV